MKKRQTLKLTHTHIMRVFYVTTPWWQISEQINVVHKLRFMHFVGNRAENAARL